MRVRSHVMLEPEHVDLLSLEYVYRACDVGGDIHVVIVLKQTPEPVAGMLLVIHNENGGL